MKNRNKSKVLFIDQASEIGGAELNLIPIAKSLPNSTVAVFEKGIFYERLVNEKIDTAIIGISSQKFKISKEKNVLHKMLFHLPRLLAVLKKMISIMKEYEIVIFNTQKSLAFGIFPAILLRKKTILYLHDIISEDHFSSTNIKVIVICANRCAEVICNSNATREAFIARGGNREKATVVHCGIDGLVFDNVDPANIKKFKKKTGLTAKATIGSFSRIAAWKGQHVLIKAMKNLPKDYHCLIVGSPFFGEDKYYSKLIKMVQRYGLIDRVHFIGFNDNVPLLMKCCDVIVHTSVAPEPFGRVIVEAMLANRPIIATDMGGAKEIIEDSATGRLIKPNDHKLLAIEINKIVTNKSLTEEYSARAKASAIRNFSEKKMVQHVKKLISKIQPR